MENILVGNLVRIYSSEDEDLQEWLENQDTDTFEIEEVDEESCEFWVKGCEYGINDYTFTDYEIIGRC
jgi:hypothetical protein